MKRLHDRVLVDGQVSKELSDLFALLAVQSVDALGFVVRVGPRLQLATAVDHGQGALSQLLQHNRRHMRNYKVKMVVGLGIEQDRQKTDQKKHKKHKKKNNNTYGVVDDTPNFRLPQRS